MSYLDGILGGARARSLGTNDPNVSVNVDEAAPPGAADQVLATTGVGVTTAWVPRNSGGPGAIVSVSTSGAVVHSTLYLCTTTGGSITLSLPAAATCALKTISFKRLTGGSNSLILDPSGAEQIDGSGTLNLTIQYEWCTLVSDGTRWHQIG